MMREVHVHHLHVRGRIVAIGAALSCKVMKMKIWTFASFIDPRRAQILEPE
jgi:hypothetical protein